MELAFEFKHQRQHRQSSQFINLFIDKSTAEMVTTTTLTISGHLITSTPIPWRNRPKIDRVLMFMDWRVSDSAAWVGAYKRWMSDWMRLPSWSDAHTIYISRGITFTTAGQSEESTVHCFQPSQPVSQTSYIIRQWSATTLPLYRASRVTFRPIHPSIPMPGRSVIQCSAVVLRVL